MNMERKVYKVKLENAEIWVLKPPPETPNTIVLEKRNDEWKAYLIVDETEAEEIDRRLVPYFVWLAEMWEEMREVEKMLSENDI
jgi:hypothetical protein